MKTWFVPVAASLLFVMACGNDAKSPAEAAPAAEAPAAPVDAAPAAPAEMPAAQPAAIEAAAMPGSPDMPAPAAPEKGAYLAQAERELAALDQAAKGAGMGEDSDYRAARSRATAQLADVKAAGDTGWADAQRELDTTLADLRLLLQQGQMDKSAPNDAPDAE